MVSWGGSWNSFALVLWIVDIKSEKKVFIESVCGFGLFSGSFWLFSGVELISEEISLIFDAGARLPLLEASVSSSLSLRLAMRDFRGSTVLSFINESVFWKEGK